MDQYQMKHLMPLFLSKISAPDTYSMHRGDRAIRTMGEVAHYVRCIAFHNDIIPKVWSSPDYLLTTKKGSSTDHALLMASMFKGVFYEGWNEYQIGKKINEIKDEKQQKRAAT